MMKYLILIFLITSCTQKYRTYPVIKKNTFNYNKEHNPVTPKMLMAQKEVQKTCEGQFFFNRNADKITQGSIPALVQYSCPGQDYLLNAKITQTWWTTIIYTRSCVELESFCPQKRKK